jgi:starch synthase
MKTIKVLFLASEADPLVKVGGLGDVAGSLPPALLRLGAEKTGGYRVDVRTVIPFHSALRKKLIDPELLFEFDVMAVDGPVKAGAYRTEANGVPVYLIAGEPIKADAPVYSPDAALNGQVYTFFSLATLELARKLDWRPDILHANDWHTALAVYALKTTYAAEAFFKDVRSVLSVHNLPFMGAGGEAAFDRYGLPPSRYPLMPWWGKKVPLPLGLQTANRIVAVSRTYAQEIMTPEYGCGLEVMLQARRKSVTGIVNGLDMDAWNPATDANLPVNFSVDTLAKRQENKLALLKEFSLHPDPAIPLLILISRMDQQKGVDLAVEGLERAILSDWQAILLGTGNPDLEEACRKLEREYPDRIRAAIRFDTNLSRRMYAGGDILLMPSRYEPCGLAQMMAMRYGCAPLARATGGLQDTIVDATNDPANGTGFLFKPATGAALAGALERALEAYADKRRWKAIQERGMREDFSWEKSALEYVRLYRELVAH